jgi:hypothetical protein
MWTDPTVRGVRAAELLTNYEGFVSTNSHGR